MGQKLEFLSINHQSKSVVLMLHGYGANHQDLYPLADYLDRSQSFDWVFANGPIRIPFNAWMEGRAWFPVDMQDLEEARRSGRPREFAAKLPPELSNSLNLVEDLIVDLEQRYESIILGGFSQGAMMVSHLLARRTGKIKAAILLSGVLVAKAWFDDALSQHSTRVPIFQSHGRQDDILDVRLGEELHQHLVQKGFSVEFHSFSGGHEIPLEVLKSGANFLSSLNTSHS